MKPQSPVMAETPRAWASAVQVAEKGHAPGARLMLLLGLHLFAGGKQWYIHIISHNV